MTDANVKLSDAELSLVCDEQFILTKNNIINKVFILFGELSENFLQQVEGYRQHLPSEVVRLSPKIFKGEYYKGLPYVTLDFPRFFSKEDIFAVRCFFWWGNFFSLTLHLSGSYALKYEHAVNSFLQQHPEWYVCVNENQWEYHFDRDNYVSAGEVSMTSPGSRMLPGKSFIKIAKNIPLRQWDKASDFFTTGFQDLLMMFA